MKPFTVPLLLLLFEFVCQICYGVAPFEKKFTVEVFAGQRFESEVCTAKDGLSPIWSINGTRLIDRDVIDSFNAHVPRNTNNGLRQATLILSLVNSAFNDSVLLCSTNLTQILAYKMFVVNTIVKWLAINETFHPEICTSLLVNSSSPYWVIDGNPLINPSEKQRYGASVYSSNDIDGRYQAELVIISVNETLSGSNVSCIVASELRRVYILRTIPSNGEGRTMDATTAAASSAIGAGTSNDVLRNAVTGVLVPFGVVVFAVLCIVALCAFLTKKGLIFSNERENKTADSEAERKCLDETLPVEPPVSVESTPTSNNQDSWLYIHRYRQRTVSVQRGVPGGEEATNERQEQAVKFHCENKSTEGEQSGTDSGCGVLEVNQGDECAAVKVYPGKDEVECQKVPNSCLKWVLTKDDLSKQRIKQCELETDN